MINERLYRTDAIILRLADFGEADRLLTLFTPDRGKLRLLAKGVRKTTSRKAGHVELFMLTDLLVAVGSTWDIISQAEIVEAYRDLREDLDKPGYAYYLAEVVDRFTEEHDPNAPLVELLALTLARLNHLDDPFITLRYFEMRLLSLTGFQPQLHFCVSCGESLEPVENYFHLVDRSTRPTRRCSTRSATPRSGTSRRGSASSTAFRKGEEIGPIADEAVAIGARVLWMQLGVINHEAADKARKRGSRWSWTAA